MGGFREPRSEVLEVGDLAKRGERDQLVEKLGSSTVELGIPVRDEAARALARLGDHAGIERLAELVSNESMSVRFSAVEALGRIGAPEVVAALIVALEDDSDIVVSRAAQSLGLVGGEPAVKALERLLSRRETGFRLDAVRALGNSRHFSAIDLLKMTLNDPSRRVRRAARQELRRLGACCDGDK